MATAYTREWIHFFTGCGIPDDVAAMYALIFCENRIQKNMLLDLNKEYLRDMGITVMGDVIAILRHAKIIHEKYIRDKILLVEDKMSLEQHIVNDSSLEPKKSTPMKRMLERYTRKYNSEETESISDVQVIVQNESVTPVPKKVSEKTGTQIPLKKKIQLTAKPNNEIGLEVPVPKVRRVLPENEGGYKIKMPSGSTERSKKLLEQAKKRKIKTVFDRLGESSVSSTTSEISSSPSSSTSNTLRTQSVFSRLGEKTSVVVSSTSFDESTNITEEQLPYAGILKTGTPKKFVPNTTMRADEQEKSEVRKLNLKRGVSVKKRLGLAKQSPEVNSTGRSILKAARTLNTKKGDLASKNSTIKLTNKIGSTTVGARSKIFPENNNLKEESSQGKVVVSTTTKILNKDVRGVKRKLEVNSSESNISGSSKKVRFGKTTHRLIPPAQNSTQPTNYVKNYPKLTMIISNRVSTGGKAGSLNSDNLMRPRLGVKDRIGNKSVQDRLGKKIGSQVPRRGSEKIKRIQDRLG